MESTFPATTKEGYAKKLQLLCVNFTKYLKVEFHSGEADNSNARRTTLTVLVYIISATDCRGLM